jgi:hypothetical protein
MLIRIKEKNSGLFVGVHDAGSRNFFDLYPHYCDIVYKAQSIKDADTICALLNTLPVTYNKPLEKWKSWEFVVDVQY